MSASMRNAIQRRVHRERAQPFERQRLGLLEKRKDYSLRASEYNKKKKQLHALRIKAANRNEDEFYFGMMSRRGPGSAITAGGPHGNGKKGWAGTASAKNDDRGDGVRALSVDTVRLLKTQDLGYVRTMRNVAAKDLRRLEQQAVLAGIPVGRGSDDSRTSKRKRPGEMGWNGIKRIVFCDEEQERQETMQQTGGGKAKGDNRNGNDHEGEDAMDEDEDEWEGLGDGGDDGGASVDPAEADKQKAREKLAKELEHARHKARVLAEAEAELEEQQAKMAKTATSGGFTKRGKQIMVHRRKR